MRKVTLKDDAVSPVIGVMLMLVVTVVIAAVVVGFSTGLAGDTSKTPMALFDVEYSELSPRVSDELGLVMGTPYEFPAGMFGVMNIGFIHKGGDKIPLNDIQIVIEICDGYNDGFIYTYEYDEYNTKTYGPMAELFFPDNWNEMMYKEIPIVTVLGQEDDLDNAVVSTGDIINLFVYHFSSGNVNFAPGQTFLWTVYHTPTNSVIAKGEYNIPTQ